MLVAPLFTIDSTTAQSTYSRSQLNANGIPELTNAHHQLPSSANASWFSQVTDHIQELENKFYPANQQKHFRVANSSNRLAFEISPNGYSVQQVQEQYQEVGWKMHFNILGAYRKKILLDPSVYCKAHTEQQMLRYSYNNIEVQYTNNEAGLRQNFIIHENLQEKEKIKVRISVTGTLSPVLENNKIKVVYKRQSTAIGIAV